MTTICHISTWDRSGGAAIAAHRLHKSLLNLGCGSSMFVQNRLLNREVDIFQFQRSPKFHLKVLRRLRGLNLELSKKLYTFQRPEGLDKFTDDRSGYCGEFIDAVPPSEILHFHWAADFIQMGNVVRRIGGQVPLVFTLHDMNLFTGGCHYDLNCGKFKTQCGACPQLGSNFLRDRAYCNFLRRRRAFKKLGSSDVKIVCPSAWMASEAASSKVLGHLDVEVIANGIDLDIFYARNKDNAREALGIPKHMRVVLFVSEATANKRKGLGLLVEALSAMTRKSGLLLLTVGNGIPENLPQLPHVHIGSINSESLMASVYSAADLFVAPYEQDNLPNTIIESMACETPVVAFDTGGIPEIVTHRLNGILLREKSANELGKELDTLLASDNEISRLSAGCRSEVERKFDSTKQGKRYLELYETLLAERDER